MDQIREGKALGSYQKQIVSFLKNLFCGARNDLFSRRWGKRSRASYRDKKENFVTLRNISKISNEIYLLRLTIKNAKFKLVAILTLFAFESICERILFSRLCSRSRFLFFFFFFSFFLSSLNFNFEYGSGYFPLC